jgi:hypothetical protein
MFSLIRNKILFVLMVHFLRNGKDIELELILESDSEEAVLSESDSRHEDAASVGHESIAYGSLVCIQLRPQHSWNSGDVPPFAGGPSQLKIQEAPHVNKTCTPVTTFLLFCNGSDSVVGSRD